MEGPVVVPATSSGARRRRASETPEEIASKSLVALVILMPVTVLATSAIILWRPFLCAWFKFFRVSLLELAVASPFVAFCACRVGCIFKGTWLAASWSAIVLLELLPFWWWTLPPRWRPLCIYIPLVLFYFPREKRMDPALDDVESPAKVTNKCGPGTSLAPSSPPGLVEPLLSEVVVKKNNKYRLLLEAALWHLPQRLAATCLYRLSGARIYEPLATIIDSRIAIGTSPLSTSDILELSTKYRVGSVLEICSPFSCLSLGQSAYSAHVGPRDVVQAHERVGLSCEDLRVATSSIRRRIDDEPHKRCFIACNDGSRFAPVVAAAFICVSQRCELGQAVDLLERRLPEDKSINFHRIRTDPALRALSDKINDEKDLDGWALVDKGDFLP